MANLDIRALAHKAGFRGKALDTMVAIIQAESGGNPQAHNGNAKTGDNSYGLAQINMLGAMGPERLKQYGLKSNEDLFDPLTNLRVAYRMSNAGKNFNPWSTYKRGDYQQYLGGAVPKGSKAAGSSGSPGIDARELAAQYGWNMALLKSDKGLWNTFNKAVKETWSAARFVAEVRGTPWFQKHSEAARNAAVLQKTDPATWNAKVAQTRASVQDMAVKLGAQVGSKSLNNIVNNVLTYGWNDAQIQNTLAESVKIGGEGTYGGQAAVTSEQLRQTALNNGVKLNDSALQSWVQRVAAGEDPAGFDAYIRKMSASAFPQWADEINAGTNVADIASPYVNQMAQTLEIDPKNVDLFDPTIRKALQAQDPDTGKPTSKPLWQFETELKKDPRWLSTNNARDALDGVGRSVLQSFGLGN